MMMATSVFVLLVGVVEDLRSKKVKNVLILSLFVLSLCVVLWVEGMSFFPMAMLSFVTALAMGFPLFLLGVLGAADVKLFSVLALLLTWNEVLVVGAWALVWGALLGVVRALLSGEGLKVFSNVWRVLRLQGAPEKQELHFIPFTVALLFGWMTNLVMNQYGGFWL